MSALKDAVDTNEAIDGLVGASKAVAPPPELTNDELEEDLAFLRAASTNIKDDDGDKERPSKKSKGQEFLKAPPTNTRTRVGSDFQVDLSFLNNKDDDDGGGDKQEQR
jgi:hypothetical protein